MQGDTGPDLVATLFQQDDPTIVLDNLDEATGVRFQMRKPDDRRFTVNAPADIVNALTGRVKYQWGPNDLAVPGEYDIQFEITYVDAVIQTQAVPNRITVRRK